ncbi:DinB family protein [Streptomyces sp. A7024]|uniref:DinB family protein n=1 Tax=Streptomyces coryli TaxID=1128680 RepID=A0A6G4TSR3_9ACTN|nr:DinB family protein [Streptomyces coryli]
MSWTAPKIDRQEGPLVGPERAMLQDYLNWHRDTLLLKCEGLTAEQLGTAAVPTSNLTLHGLVRHLTKVERSWFRQDVAGEDVPKLYSTAERPDADYEDLDASAAEADFAAYRDEVAACDAVMAGYELDDTFTFGRVERQTMSVRCLYLHMIEEYARHNGHADMIRQAIDGVTGE